MKKIIFLMTVVTAFAFSSCCGNKECNTDQGNATQAVLNKIMQRKSVRAYTEQPIGDDTINSILRAAMAAPSAIDVRPWSFVVLKNKSQYAKVFEGNFNMDKFMQSAVVVVMCADTTRVVRGSENGEREPNGYWRDDLGAATENLLLAVEAYGLGAVWTACYPNPDRMNPVRTSLGLPENVVPYAVVPIGHHNGTTQPKDKWDESRIHIEKW